MEQVWSTYVPAQLDDVTTKLAMLNDLKLNLGPETITVSGIGLIRDIHRVSVHVQTDDGPLQETRDYLVYSGRVDGSVNSTVEIILSEDSYYLRAVDEEQGVIHQLGSFNETHDHSSKSQCRTSCGDSDGGTIRGQPKPATPPGPDSTVNMCEESEFTFLHSVFMESDYEFYDQTGSSWDETLLAIGSDMVAPFWLDSCTSISYDQVGGYTSSDQPYTSSNPSILLAQLRNHWEDSDHEDIQRSYVYLVSGKDLGTTGGTAYGGGCCYPDSDRAYALGQYTGDSWLDGIIGAHEGGHVFNGVHEEAIRETDDFTNCPDQAGWEWRCTILSDIVLDPSVQDYEFTNDNANLIFVEAEDAVS